MYFNADLCKSRFFCIKAKGDWSCNLTQEKNADFNIWNETVWELFFGICYVWQVRGQYMFVLYTSLLHKYRTIRK